tara:strand:- start:266 stop:1408 length:1143 start_codon:yes stop_codon:yes gene_type:complete
MKDEEKETPEVISQVTETPNEPVFGSASDDSVAKVNLSAPAEEIPLVEAVTEPTNEDVPAEIDTPIVATVEETPAVEIEEIIAGEEDPVAEEEIIHTDTPGETTRVVPENLEKLVEFMEETGGDLSDYLKLNQDYSKLDEDSLLKEYYAKTKPHLNHEEIKFLMEDTFSYDEDLDEDREIRRKKLALKEQVANAKTHLDGEKSKYYKEIKSGSKLTGEQQKAIDFFNRYNEESEVSKQSTQHNSEVFTKKTDEVFNDTFKGFEYNIGDKKFRVNVKNAEETKTAQSSLNNFTKKFLDKKMGLQDAKGYHKSLYTAMNADAVANHFYEQGKADAIKSSIAKTKNIDMSPRASHGEVIPSGVKVKVLSGDTPDYKFKIKNRK